MNTVTLVILICAAVVSAKRHYKKEVLDEFQQFLDEKKNEEDLSSTKIQKRDSIPATEDVDNNGNRDTCDAIGVNCHYCTDCFPGGWCVTGKTTEPKCICKHGWTGPLAEYVTSQSTHYVTEGRNRIFAQSCGTACFYNHDYRGTTCGTDCPYGQCLHDIIPCEENCSPVSYGKCLSHGKQECCRGWSGDDGVYDVARNAYVATCCNKKCPYLGVGVPNPDCATEPTPIGDCDPLCYENNGKCISETGKCECCLGWTGPNPELQADGTMHADYCDVYCPYTKENPDKKCANPNYVHRLHYEPTRVYPIYVP